MIHALKAEKTKHPKLSNKIIWDVSFLVEAIGVKPVFNRKPPFLRSETRLQSQRFRPNPNRERRFRRCF